MLLTNQWFFLGLWNNGQSGLNIIYRVDFMTSSFMAKLDLFDSGTVDLKNLGNLLFVLLCLHPLCC